MLILNFGYNVFQIIFFRKLRSFGLNEAKIADIKKSLFMKDLNDILFSNLRTDVEDWSILSNMKDRHIKDWFILNTNDKWILKTDTYF